MMKLGFCTAFSNLDLLEKAGIDNLETTVYEIMQWSDEQVREIARLLGGDHITETTLQSARELIESSFC